MKFSPSTIFSPLRPIYTYGLHAHVCLCLGQMLKFDGDGDKHGQGDGVCKQTIIVTEKGKSPDRRVLDRSTTHAFLSLSTVC